jgi:RNA polymerase sigma-32 factor
MRSACSAPNGLRRAARSTPLLAAEEERELARRIQAGNGAALDALVCAHLRLVYAIAGSFRATGARNDDLVSEGSLALVIAARRFDPRHGLRFSTYAGYWIRALLRRFSLLDRRIVRPPSTRDARRVLANLNRSERKLSQESGSAPDQDAIAQELGVTTSEVEQAALALYSRDLPIGSGEGAVDVATAEADPETLVARAEERQANSAQLSHALDALNERERDIVQARYLREIPASLAAIGSDLGLSRERVRQIESRAYAKLQAVLASVA